MLIFLIYIPVELKQVFDATNSTAERRKMIHDLVVNKWGYKLFFVESICDDPKIIEQNIMVIHFFTSMFPYHGIPIKNLIHFVVVDIFVGGKSKQPGLYKYEHRRRFT